MSTLNSFQKYVSGSSYLHTLQLYQMPDQCFINRLTTVTVSEHFICFHKLFHTMRDSSLNLQPRFLCTSRKLQEKDVKMLTGIKDPETLKFQLISNSNVNFNQFLIWHTIIFAQCHLCNFWEMWRSKPSNVSW